MGVMILLISLLLGGVNLQPAQDSERTKELAAAVELSAQVVKLYNERRYKDALPLAQQVIEIRQRFLFPDDLILGDALFNLGELYLAEKKTSEADKLFQRCLAIYESHADSNKLVIARILERLANIRVLKADFDRAVPLYLRSVSIREKEQGESNPATINAMKNYACTDLLAHGNEAKVLANDSDSTGMALTRRAICWLGEFVDNCSEETQSKPEDVLNPKAIKLALPPYPPAARKNHLSGKAFVAVLIDELGNVSKARSVCGGYSDLNTVSVDAARSSKFSPTLVNQKPIKVTGVLVYNFIAQQR
jgi:TonB family protein